MSAEVEDRTGRQPLLEQSFPDPLNPGSSPGGDRRVDVFDPGTQVAYEAKVGFKYFGSTERRQFGRDLALLDSTTCTCL